MVSAPKEISFMKKTVAGSRSRRHTRRGSAPAAQAAVDPDTLGKLEKVEEVRIVTGTLDAKKHAATIWVVVVDGNVFIRSFTGPKGRWYKNILANPKADVEIDGERLQVNAEPLTEPPLIEKVSSAYLEKYRGSPYAKDMVRPEVLPTTLRLTPGIMSGAGRGPLTHLSR
jgi:hypothetical protein